MHQIQLYGTDGSVWRYYAVAGPEFSAAETGWELTLARAGEPIVQALTVKEVVDDLRAMAPEEPRLVATAKALTLAMIKSLEGRASEGEEIQKRAAELRREYEEAFAESPEGSVSE